jgi:UDP-N-acetylmuramate-alanine ligase
LLAFSSLCCVFACHAGKSTTVAMLAVALCSLGEDITVILGAQVPQVLFFNQQADLGGVFSMICQTFLLKEKQLGGTG